MRLHERTEQYLLRNIYLDVLCAWQPKAGDRMEAMLQGSQEVQLRCAFQKPTFGSTTGPSFRGVTRLYDGGFEGTARKSACNPLRRVARIHSAANHDCTFNNQFCISASFSNQRHISSAGWSTDPCHMRHFGTSPSASRPNVFCIRTCILTSRQHLNAPHAWAAPRLRRLVAERAWRPGSPPPAPPSSPLPPVPAALCC